jgi:hypothetical protein
MLSSMHTWKKDCLDRIYFGKISGSTLGGIQCLPLFDPLPIFIPRPLVSCWCTLARCSLRLVHLLVARFLYIAWVVLHVFEIYLL